MCLNAHVTTPFKIINSNKQIRFFVSSLLCFFFSFFLFFLGGRDLFQCFSCKYLILPPLSACWFLRCLTSAIFVSKSILCSILILLIPKSFFFFFFQSSPKKKKGVYSSFYRFESQQWSKLLSYTTIFQPFGLFSGVWAFHLPYFHSFVSKISINNPTALQKKKKKERKELNFNPLIYI